MKAQELRLGNWVSDKLGRLIQISEIRKEHYVFYLSNNRKVKYHINSAIGIPLTEDWLIKFGFEKKEWTGKDYKDDTVSGVDYFHKEECVRLSMNNEICQKGVHWLQNWFYFETGKELEIK